MHLTKELLLDCSSARDNGTDSRRTYMVYKSDGDMSSNDRKESDEKCGGAEVVVRNETKQSKMAKMLCCHS